MLGLGTKSIPIIVTVLIGLGVGFLFVFQSFRHMPTPEESPSVERGYIDTHVHLFGTYRRGGAIITDYAAAADNLIAHMDRFGVAKALVMSPPQTPWVTTNIPDYKDLSEVVKNHSDRLYLVAGGGVLNPLIHTYKASEVTSKVRAQFEEEAENLISVGAKAFGEMAALHLSFNPKHPFEEVSPDHPLFLLLADIAARHNVPIDLHMEAVPNDMDTPPGFDRRSKNNPPTLRANISGLERLLGHNPDARIVWQHIGWDNTGHMTVDLLRRLLEAHPNLYLALRVEKRETTVAGSPMPNRIVDGNWQIRPEWMEFLSDFPDRFMVGSDEFLRSPGKRQLKSQSFEETWPILDQLPPDLARKVGHDNAARIYNLD